MKINQKENGVFEVEVDGQIIGEGRMDSDDDGNYLEGLDIEEAHRGQGYGTKALHELAEVYGSYFLAPDNEGAQRLYERVAEPMKEKDYNEFGFAIDQGFGVYEI